MAKRPLTFDSVLAVAGEFPDLVEGTTYGSPAILLGKRMVACIPTHKSAEPGSLAVRTDFEQREAMLRDDPETFYLKEHYASHPVVLVRMARLGKDQLRDLIAAGRRFVLSHEAGKRRPVKRK
jgi:hypothetical protein